MDGIQLTFFVHENQKIHGKLAYEWLLERAREIGIHGGSAFRAVAGFGRHGVLHENHFFELAGDLPVSVTFVISPQEADSLLGEVSRQDLALFYVRSAAQFGVAGGQPRK